MPHSSNHFLQMVELQLWDGLPLRRGLNNNLVASPSVVDKNHHSGLSRFSNSNLTHLAFQEYHPPPMQKYTLAFAGGQPAGPVFVIRMSDEVGIDEEHEATFASVVSGHDVLDLIVKIFIENPNSKNALKMDRIQILHGGSKAANKE
jgi:cyclophilin family peptidyl-prolyl cis-trans isomerase